MAPADILSTSDRTAFHLSVYCVRESKRARRVTIRLSSWAGLEVVVPVGFDRSEIPGILRSKADWIIKNQELTGPVEELERPTSIGLELLDETWRPDYSPAPGNQLNLSERQGHVLSLTGPVDDPVAVAAALNQWLQQRAKDVLVPWLHQLSTELSLQVNRVAVRRQKTKWGSCSAQKSISLNRNLLFLPEITARYVLVHELCHVRQLNHSEKFWRLLETFEPKARQTAKKIRDAGKLVPRWAMV